MEEATRAEFDNVPANEEDRAHELDKSADSIFNGIKETGDDDGVVDKEGRIGDRDAVDSRRRDECHRLQYHACMYCCIMFKVIQGALSDLKTRTKL
jgi:hypothetical protein